MQLPIITWDRIKRIKLRRCGKLDFTYNGKLQPPQLIQFGTAVHKPQYIAAAAVDVDELQYKRVSCSCTAAATVGVDAPQNKPFYTVPYYYMCLVNVRMVRIWFLFQLFEIILFSFFNAHISTDKQTVVEVKAARGANTGLQTRGPNICIKIS